MLHLAQNPNAAFASDDKTLIDCDVVIDGKTVRFSAHKHDVEPHGQAIYEELMLKPRRIAPYVPPAEPPAAE